MTDHYDTAGEGPWDDLDRWPALLRRLQRLAADLQVEVEHERRIWRAHHPALRAGLDQDQVDPDSELAVLREQDQGFTRVARQLHRLGERVEEVLEDLAHPLRARRPPPGGWQPPRNLPVAEQARVREEYQRRADLRQTQLDQALASIHQPTGRSPEETAELRARLDDLERRHAAKFDPPAGAGEGGG